MFCQLMTRCYAHAPDLALALRCQSLVTYVHFEPGTTGAEGCNRRCQENQ